MIVQYEINIPGSSINEKPNSTISAMLCTGGYFCKEKLPLSCQNSFSRYCKIVKFNIFELIFFSFNSYVYWFYCSSRAFNPVTFVFSLLTRGFELVTCGFELATRNSCFTFPQFLIQCHHSPSLSAYLIKFAFCPFHNTCTISHQRNSECNYCCDLIPTIESTFHN